MLRGGGGADGGVGLEDVGNGGAILEDDSNGALTFLDVGGGGGGLPAAKFAIEDGLDTGRGGGFLRLASGLGIAGAAPEGAFGAMLEGRGGVKADDGRTIPGIGGARLEGSLGAADAISESECAPSAPVAMPPLVRFNLGMPPAKSPPNCGADAIPLSPPPVP